MDCRASPGQLLKHYMTKRRPLALYIYAGAALGGQELGVGTLQMGDGGTYRHNGLVCGALARIVLLAAVLLVRHCAAKAGLHDVVSGACRGGIGRGRGGIGGQDGNGSQESGDGADAGLHFGC